VSFRPTQITNAVAWDWTYDPKYLGQPLATSAKRHPREIQTNLITNKELNVPVSGWHSYPVFGTFSINFRPPTLKLSAAFLMLSRKCRVVVKPRHDDFLPNPLPQLLTGMSPDHAGNTDMMSTQVLIKLQVNAPVTSFLSTIFTHTETPRDKGEKTWIPVLNDSLSTSNSNTTNKNKPRKFITSRLLRIAHSV
jgi:hypothetical protein